MFSEVGFLLLVCNFWTPFSMASDKPPAAKLLVWLPFSFATFDLTASEDEGLISILIILFSSTLQLPSTILLMSQLWTGPS